MWWLISVDTEVRRGLPNVVLIMIMMTVATEKSEPHGQQEIVI